MNEADKEEPPPSSSRDRNVSRPIAIREALERSASLYKQQTEKVESKYGEGGRIGGWIGTDQNQAGGIALVAIVGLLLILAFSVAGLLWTDAAQEKGLEKLEDIKNVILSILGLTGTILGYIFGRNSQAGTRGADPDNQRR